MSNVYVVMGTCGEYSDRREWPVAAFTAEEAAKERVLFASQVAREIYAIDRDLDDNFDIYDLTDKEKKSLNPHDPAMGENIIDYEVMYFYYTVPLIEKRNES